MVLQDILTFFTDSTGIGVALLLVGSFLLETLLLIQQNLSHALNGFGKAEGDITTEVRNYARKAITFASITFAAVTFVLAQFGNELALVRDTLFLFVFGLALFLVSYKIQVFGATKRIYWSLQQRLFNYGILALVFGLFLFFYEVFPEYWIPVGVMVTVVALLHVNEYKHDYRNFGRMENSDEDNQMQLQDYLE